MKSEKFRVPEGKKINLKDFAPDYTGDYKSKEVAASDLQADIARLAKLQDKLYYKTTR